MPRTDSESSKNSTVGESRPSSSNKSSTGSHRDSSYNHYSPPQSNSTSPRNFPPTPRRLPPMESPRDGRRTSISHDSLRPRPSSPPVPALAKRLSATSRNLSTPRSLYCKLLVLSIYKLLFEILFLSYVNNLYTMIFSFTASMRSLTPVEVTPRIHSPSESSSSSSSSSSPSSSTPSTPKTSDHAGNLLFSYCL